MLRKHEGGDFIKPFDRALSALTGFEDDTARTVDGFNDVPDGLREQRRCLHNLTPDQEGGSDMLQQMKGVVIVDGNQIKK